MFISFNLVIDNYNHGKCELGVPGEHNILNCLAAVGISKELDIPIDLIKKGIKSYDGVKRRFEIKYITKNNITIVDDYAHHPSEVDATIKTALEGWELNNLIVVFQPHLFSRTKEFQNEFSEVLSKADIVILTDIYPAREKEIEGVNSNLILDKIDGNKTFLINKDDVAKKVSKICSSNDMIIVMGAGDIRNITDDMYNEIIKKK